NRRAWNQILEQEKARTKRVGSRFQILLIDLDELKEVNDQKGHDAGDELLRQTGAAILTACRKSDFVARLGAPEFAVFLPAGNTAEEVVLDRIRNALDEKHISCSVGWATQRFSLTMDEIVREADMALYEEKREKKSLPPRAAIEVEREAS